RIGEALVAVKSSAFILEYFGNTWLNFSYSFPEMSVIPIENHPAGAMENWGLVQFNPSLFYYLEGRDLIAQKKSVIEVVSHELAHQWFGNLITMDWWSQLWLNEGAASFYQFFGADAYDPEGKWMDRRAVLGVQPGYYTDAFTTALPISQEVYDGSFEFAQGSIIYRKGCAIHTLLWNILGNAYFKGTTQYFKDYAYENTRNAEFLNALQQAADEQNLNLPTELTYIMEGYLYRSGVPLVRVTRTYENLQESVYFRQERFLLDGDGDGSLYFVPFRYITSGRSEESDISWMQLEDEIVLNIQFDTDSDWLLVNPERKSYLITLYDEENYFRLIRELNQENCSLTPAMKGSLFHDVAFVIEKGVLSPDVGLAMMEYLGRETSEIVWFGVLRLHEVFLTNPPSELYEQNFLANVQEALNYAVQLNEDPNNTTSYDVVIEALNMEDPVASSYICVWQNCNREFGPDVGDLDAHVLHHLSRLEGVEEYHCCWGESCKFTAEDWTDFRKHVTFHVYHAYLKRISFPVLDEIGKRCKNEEGDLEMPGDFICQVNNCGKQWISALKYYRHVKWHVSRACKIDPSKKVVDLSHYISCPWRNCNKKLYYVSRVLTHVVQSRAQEKAFACPDCGQCFESKKGFLNHLHRHGTPTHFECDSCHKRFPTKRLLRDHQRNHVNRSQCPLCSVTTSSISN
ncbi:unnamed protein product, partial [Cyprideis torosa]